MQEFPMLSKLAGKHVAQLPVHQLLPQIWAEEV